MTTQRHFQLSVNGRADARMVDVRLTLADFLHEELKLTGTHLGCGHGLCGACTILLYPLPGLEQFLQYPLARDWVHYVGDPVAVVVAENRYVAEDALDVMDVLYEPLPAVVDVKEVLRQQIVLHDKPGTNLAAQDTIAIGDIEAAFRAAP
jgi:CO/xanthine dehydrogenase Mo-binding subunit